MPIVCILPSFCRGWTGEGGGSGSNNIFQKRELDRTPNFRGNLLGKKAVTFFREGGGYNCHIKDKLKSEIFNDKKVL